MLVDRYKSHDRRPREIGREQIALDEADLAREFRVARNLTRDRDELRIDFDPHPASAVLLGGEDHDATVARPKVVDDVIARDARKLEHLEHDGLPGRHEVHVRRPLRERPFRGQPTPRRRAEASIFIWTSGSDLVSCTIVL